jgi:hypothetical protein
MVMFWVEQQNVSKRSITLIPNVGKRKIWAPASSNVYSLVSLGRKEIFSSVIIVRQERKKSSFTWAGDM